MSAAAPVVTARPTDASDEAFLRELFLHARPELAALLNVGSQGQQLIDLQLRSQREQYHGDHPQAVDHVLLLGEDRVGRCWTSRSDRVLRLLDLAVHPAYRRLGVARHALARLCEDAQMAGLPVRLSVWAANAPARALYAAAGFRETRMAGGYVAMEWHPTEPGNRP